MSKATKGNGAAVLWLREHRSHHGDECLQWPFGDCNGYGTFGFNGKTHYAHVWMCELANGPAPGPNHDASHSCGHGHLGCISPVHLSWKTRSENQIDRAAHGTKNVWSKRGKLTWEKAEEIRALKGTAPQREIAKRYGISRSQVSWIMTGKSWKKQSKGTYQVGRKWAARIKIKGEEFHLGMFETPELAQAAYLKATEDARIPLTKGERE